jgi:hypothetical protein
MLQARATEPSAAPAGLGYRSEFSRRVKNRARELKHICPGAGVEIESAPLQRHLLCQMSMTEYNVPDRAVGSAITSTHLPYSTSTVKKSAPARTFM